MNRHKRIRRVVLLSVVIGMIAGAAVVMAAAGEKVVHPELTDQEQLIACADCHRETTPEIEKEWYDSVHGLAMVKCYQCHGTFGEFVVTPPTSNCATCHADMMDKEPNTPCHECHVPHSFQAKK